MSLTHAGRRPPEARPPARVVICYYDARPVAPLIRLLRQMDERPAGLAFDVLVVVNSVTGQAPDLPQDLAGTPVLVRENGGFNLGAWNAGWAAAPDRDLYLFLQDECEILRDFWLAPFARCAARRGTGLVGESQFFYRGWAQVDTVWGDAVHRTVQEICGRAGMPAPERPNHLQTIVVAASGEVMAALGGFDEGDDKVTAFAGEILSSVRAERLGYRNCQVAWLPYRYIGHPEWTAYREASRRSAWSLKRIAWRALDRVRRR